MQTILLSGIAVALVLLCIMVIYTRNEMKKFQERTERKFDLQNKINRHFRDRFHEAEKNAPRDNQKFLSRKFPAALLIFSALAFTACATEEPQPETTPTLTVITLEGCQYYSYPTTHGYTAIEHKGNCSNPIHPENRDTIR
jgi:hypothetical protein